MRCSKHGTGHGTEHRTGHGRPRQSRSLALASLLVSLAFVTPAAHAEDIGVIGPVYAIGEPSLLDVILAHLRAAEASGELDRLQQDAGSRARRAVEQPAAVTGLTRTTRPRSFTYDPSIVVPEAITDAKGKIIVAPGTTVNPLDTVSLSQRLLFIDARDATQVTRAQAILSQQQGRVKLILTGGSYLDLMRRLHRPVYFDQQGRLTAKLGIRQVPALVSQDGKRLRIDEIL